MSMPRQQPTIARGSDVKEVLSLTVRLLTEVPLRANKRSGRSFIVTSNGVNRHASPHPSKAVSSTAPRPHLSVHYRWWTLTGTILTRQGSQTGRARAERVVRCSSDGRPCSKDPGQAFGPLRTYPKP